MFGLSKHKKRIYEIMQIGQVQDPACKAFDIFIAIVILLNLFVTLFGTFAEARPYKNILYVIEAITVAIFIIEYILRIWTAQCKYSNKTKLKAGLSFMFSFFGIIDFLTIFIFFLPMFFSSGIVAFRMLKVARIFNLFKANKYNESFKVITDVLKEKRDQLFSSVFIILVLMIASSLCMYSLEHDAQPEIFKNAFSGIWWSVSTLLTVGYGDIYPVTALGRIMAIVISFLGVGMVAIPTGILSAGFVEHQTRIKTKNSYMDETNVRFVVIKITTKHPFNGKAIKDINIPEGLIVAVIIRDDETLLPKGDLVLQTGDKLVLGAEAFRDDLGIVLKEITIKEKHPWNGDKIKTLDISRQTLILVVRRGNKIIIPNGETVIKTGDVLFVYSKKDIDEIIEGIDVDL